jgi:alpha-methylacyl-CoA racemase
VTGPLAGIRVFEIASIGPGPFAAMVLADLGADVIRIDRPGASGGGGSDPLLRGRAATIVLDLKDPEAIEMALRIVERCDVLIEGSRPGVAERLGIGPETCAVRNPRLVYGRITGWGQSGPRSASAGHDIDYLAVAGALHPIGSPDVAPVPPLNLVADFGGGGMLLVVGVLAALLERGVSGRGQVVDAAMVDGTALLMAMHFGLLAGGLWSDTRGDNLLDGGAPFYRCYRTSDDRFVAVGALEPKFYAALLDGLGVADEALPDQYDRTGWGRLGERFTAVFSGRTRDEWAAMFARRDACVAPVLTPGEAASDAHLAFRETFVEIDGVVQPAAAPRFSRTAPEATAARSGGVLADLGVTPEEIDRLQGRRSAR